MRCQRGADFRIAWLDDRINEIAALIVREKGTFHCVDGDFLEVVEREAKRFLTSREFLCHRRVAHQTVIGVEGDAKFLLIQNLERMLS